MDEVKQVSENTEPKTEVWDRASFIVIAVALFLLPIFFVPSTSFPFQLGKAYLAIGAAVLAFGFWIIARLRKGSISFPKHIIYVTIGGVVASLFLSTLFSVGFSKSLVGNADIATFGFIASMFALLFTVSSQARTKDSIFYLYLALFASFLVVSLYHLVRLLGGPDTLSFGVFTSAISNTVGKWNDLGILFGLGAVLSLVTLELAKVTAKLRYVLYVVLAFSLFFLTLVNFVSVWAVLAILSLVLFVYLFLLARRKEAVEGKKMLPVIPLIVLVISLIFVIPTGRDANGQMRYVGSKVNDTLSTKFGILHLEIRPTWGATMDVGISALKKDPLLGAGPNHFVSSWLLNKPAEVNATAFWNTDFAYGIGLIPTLFVTTGILGILAWIAFLGLLIYAGFRAILSLPEDTDQFSRYLTISSYFGALFLWIFTVFYIPSVVPVVLAFVLTGIFLGSLTEAGVIKTKELSFIDSPRAGFASVITLVFLLVLALATGYVYTQKIRGAVAFQKGVIAFNVGGNPTLAEEQFKKAVAADEEDTYYRFLSELTLIKINNLLGQNTSAVNLEKAQQELLQLFGQAKLYAETAKNINPTNYQNWLALGRVYEALVPLKVEGAYAEAVKAYDEALLLNPTSPEINLTKARLEVANGNNKGARDFIRTALAAKPNYTEAVFFLSQIEVAEGNIKEAISSVEASIFLSPTEPVLYFQLGLLKYNTSDYKGAIEALEQAVRLNGSYANARYFLGLSYDRVGRTSDAVAQFEEIQKTNSGNQEVADIIANLKAGKAPFSTSTRPPARNTLPVEESGKLPGTVDGVAE